MRVMSTPAGMLLWMPLLSASVRERPARAHRLPERITANDNRTLAGALRNSVLTIHLEAREGTWHPDAESAPGVTVRAFGVEVDHSSFRAPSSASSKARKFTRSCRTA